MKSYLIDVSEITTTSIKSKEGGELCRHCGLTVPAYRMRPGLAEQFCCSGCETVFKIISSNNLDYYYRLQRESGAGGIPAAEPVRQSDMAYFDSEEFQELHLRHWSEAGKDVASVELFLEGVHCPACVWLLESLPKLEAGFYKVRVDLNKSVAEVQFFPEKIKLSQVASVLSRFGYRPHPYRGANHATLRKAAERRLLSAMAVAGACAGNVMLLSICLYAGFFFGDEQSYWSFFRWLSFLLTFPTILWSGRIFYQRAFAALKLRQVHLDVPITIGVLSAFLASGINTIRGDGEIYFDSINIIIFLLLVSRFLQFRAQHQANEKAELLFSLLPSSVHLVDGDKVRDCALEEVVSGHFIEVRAGETVPVDGLIVEGESLVDCSVLTGEAVPIAAKQGMRLHAAMVNLVSPLKLSVESTGEQTRIGRLAQLASDIQRKKPLVLHQVDRLSKWFVVVVLLLGVVGFVLGLSESTSEAFERLVALLIISCPCALGMATPLALSVAMGNAARVGIHLRNATAIELVAKVKQIVFDKTGTLTKGKFQIHKWWGDRDVGPLVCALESRSSHVVARSLATALSIVSQSSKVENVVEFSGLGIKGVVDGREVAVGNSAFIVENDFLIPDAAKEAIDDFSVSGLTPILVGVDGQLSSVIGLGDPLQDGAKDILSQLQWAGYQLHLLSGDNSKVVLNTAKLLNIPAEFAYGEVTPEGKVQKIVEIERDGHCLMFGDGTNDAAALASATVGIAVHGGAEASFLIADGFFSRPDIRLVSRLIDGSKNTLRVVNRGLISSLAFNLTGCLLAIFGYVSPLVAALLMPTSSLIVVALAFSQRSFLKEGRWK